MAEMRDTAGGEADVSPLERYLQEVDRGNMDLDKNDHNNNDISNGQGSSSNDSRSTREEMKMMKRGVKRKANGMLVHDLSEEGRGEEENIVPALNPVDQNPADTLPPPFPFPCSLPLLHPYNHNSTTQPSSSSSSYPRNPGPESPLEQLFTPPPAFGEKFKFVICSSGLLDRGPKEVRKTGKEVMDSEGGMMFDKEEGRDVTDTDPGDRISVVGSPEMIDLVRFETTGKGSRSISPSARRPLPPPIHTLLTSPSIRNGPIVIPQTSTTTSAQHSRASSSNSAGTGTTTYITASPTSARSLTTTPRMILGSLPGGDFSESSSRGSTPRGEVREGTEMSGLEEGLRRRGKSRKGTRGLMGLTPLSLSTQRHPSHSKSYPHSRPSQSHPRSGAKKSWTSLFLPLSSFLLKSSFQVASFLIIWTGIQVLLILGVGSWLVQMVLGSLRKKVCRILGIGEEVRRVGVGKGGEGRMERIEEEVEGDGEEVVEPQVIEKEDSRALVQTSADIGIEVETKERSSIQGSALGALKEFIEKSDRLDVVVGKALAVVADSENKPEVASTQVLRQRLHRSFADLSSSMTSASSSLLPLLSENELAALSGLYKLDERSNNSPLSVKDRGNRYSSSSVGSSKRNSFGAFDRSHSSGFGGDDTVDPVDPGGIQLPPLDSMESQFYSPTSEREGEMGLGFPFVPRSSEEQMKDGGGETKSIGYRPRPLLLRSSRSTSQLNSSPRVAQDRFTPLPPRSPRPSSVMGMATYNRKRTKSRTQSLAGSGTTSIVRSSSMSGYLSSGSERFPTFVASPLMESTPRARVFDFKRDRSGVEGFNRRQNLSRQREETVRPMSLQSVPASPPAVEVGVQKTPIKPITSTLSRPTPKLRPLRLSQTGFSALLGDDDDIHSRTARTVPHSPAMGPPRSPIPGWDPRSHRRKRSSISSIGYRQPSEDYPNSIPPSPRFGPGSGRDIRSHRMQASFSEEIPKDMAEFVKGLPGDLVQALRTRNRPSVGNTSDRETFSSGTRQRLSNRSFTLGGRDSLAPSLVTDPTLSDGGSSSISSLLPRDNSSRSHYRSSSQSNPDSRAKYSSLGPLTISSLKAAYFGMHTKRRRTACYLLALNFENGQLNKFSSEEDTSTGDDDAAAEALARKQQKRKDRDPVAIARYWADVHAILDDVSRALERTTESISSALTATVSGPPAINLLNPSSNILSPELGSATTVPPPLPYLPSMPHDPFAPRYSDHLLLQAEIDGLARILELANQRIGDLRRLVAGTTSANPIGSLGGPARSGMTSDQDRLLLTRQWDLLRNDLGMMIREWERGRNIVSRMTTSDAGLAIEPVGPAEEQEKAREQEMMLPLDHDPNTSISTESSILSDIPSHPNHAGTNDDVTSHLLETTSPNALPLPGAEMVFEGFVAPESRTGGTQWMTKDGRKMNREERIEAIKLLRLQKMGEGHPAEKGERGQGNGNALDMTDRRTKVQAGEMAKELKDVLGRLREHKELLGIAVERGKDR